MDVFIGDPNLMITNTKVNFGEDCSNIEFINGGDRKAVFDCDHIECIIINIKVSFDVNRSGGGDTMIMVSCRWKSTKVRADMLICVD